MKILITESQLKSIVVSEQIAGLMFPSAAVIPLVAKGIDAVVNMDQHTKNGLLELGAAFIPVVGPAISAGIAAYDASLYYKEGKTKEAGLALVLGLLPGIGAVTNKIPGVKQLGQKGMNMLADKIAKGITKLTPLESEVMQGINLNKNLVHAEADGLIRRVANNVANKTTQKTFHPVVNKAVNLADKASLGQTAIKQGVAQTYNAGYNALNR